MRLKPGSTIVVPRGTDDDDEDISADVAESAVLAIEPDVPDTRKMLIRVRRKQSMAAVRRCVTTCRSAQLRAWNRTHRDTIMPGQVIVLHVPVRHVRCRPSRVRSASRPTGGGVESRPRRERRIATKDRHARRRSRKSSRR